MFSPKRRVRSLRAGAVAVATAAVVISSLGFAPQVISVGSEADPFLTVRARGATGLEQMEVSVGGEVLTTITVGTEWADYRVDTGAVTGATDVQVAFVNDAVTPKDQNLRVDHVRYGGQTYEAEAETTFATGVWQNGGLCRPGYHRSELLACEGYLRFGDLAGSRAVGTDGGAAATGGSTIIVGATGQTGNELIEVRVRGQVVATFETNDSDDIDDAPDFQTHGYDHGTTVAPGDVEVAFVNDRYVNGVDHNVRIGWVDIDGTRYDIDRWSLQLTSERYRDVCTKSWDANWVVACNGSLHLTDPGSVPEPSQPDVPAAPSAEPGSDAVAPPVDAPTPAPTVEPAPDPTPTPVETGSESERVAEEPLVEHPPVIVPEFAPPPPDNSGPVARDPRSAGTGNFYVVGSDIIGPDGKIFYPIGANVAIKFTPYGYVFEGNNGGVNDHLGDVKEWNWNTIRATLICDNDSGVPTFDELVDGIHPTIERFTAAGIVVMLECHDSTGTDPKIGSAKDLAIRRFWDEMASRYKDNPYVWFNIYNEPYRSDDGANWARLHQFYIDRIRATGAENIIVADIPIWGQGIHLLAEQSFADGINQECNTVFGWHAYGAIDGRQGSLADHERNIRLVQAKDMAVVIGEYGVASPKEWGNAGPWRWNISGFDAMTELGPKYGIGLLWWHATGDQAYFSLYALKNDRSGFWTSGNDGNLTPYGQEFWDVSQRVSHDRGVFPGDLADSGCPSVAG